MQKKMLLDGATTSVHSHVHPKLELQTCTNMLPNYILKLYFTMVQPYLTYGIILWGSTYQSYLKRTVILQKKAIRYIHKADYNAHTKPLFYASNVLNIHYTPLYIFTGSSQFYA